MKHAYPANWRLAIVVGMMLGLAVLLAGCAVPATGVTPAPTAISVPPTPDTGTSPLPAPGEATSPLPAPGNEQPALFVRRTGGVAGRADSWTIYPDGRVVTSKGKEYQSGSEAVTTALGALENAGFFEMKDSYGLNSGCADCFNYQITATSKGRTKTVQFVEGAKDMPQGLNDAMAVIGNLIKNAPQS